MQCGQSVWCVVLQWLAEHGAAKEIIEGLEPFIRGDEQAVAHFYERLKSLLTIAVTLVSGSFAIWKWWHFREAVLHKRLGEYLNESDHRLGPTTRAVVRLIARPDRRSNFRQPAFAMELSRILQRRNWETAIATGYGPTVEDRQLKRVVEAIDKRINTTDKALESLHKQRAAADTIAAALAAARAAHAKDPITAEKYDKEALRRFSSVLSTPGHKTDLIAKEGKAFHLLRTSELTSALNEFQELEELAADVLNERDRVLLIARARRYQALIMQARNPAPAAAAWTLISPNGGALDMCREHAPMLDAWDAYEYAELNYAAAYLAHRNNFVQQEPQRLRVAIETFQSLANQFPKNRPLLIASNRRLRTAVRNGLERALRAQNEKDGSKVYDLKWLYQSDPAQATTTPAIRSTSTPSQKTNDPAEPIGSA